LAVLLGPNTLGGAIWLFGYYNSQIYNAAFSYMGNGDAAFVYPFVKTFPGLRSEFWRSNTICVYIRVVW